MSTQMSFFQTVQSLGAVAYAKPKAVKLQDPLAQAKAKFALTADKQAALIKAAADKGLWFKKEGDSYILTLKNGVAAINKENGTYKLANAAQAVKFLELAKEACAKGEFDALLTATNRGPRKPKEVAAAPVAAPATPAANDATPAPAPKAPKRK